MEETKTKEQTKYIENKTKMADFKPNRIDGYLKGKLPKHSTKRQSCQIG